MSGGEAVTVTVKNRLSPGLHNEVMTLVVLVRSETVGIAGAEAEQDRTIMMFVLFERLPPRCGIPEWPAQCSVQASFSNAAALPTA